MKEQLSKLDNKNVTLRLIDDADAVFLMELNNDLEIAQYVVGNPRIVTLQEQMEWMKNAKADTLTKRFIVEYDGLSVGTIILSNIDLTNLTTNINIKLKKTSRGKGIGKQSIKLALEYCFKIMNIFCVTAHVLSFNEASLALFKSCGFTEEGILRSRVIKNNKRCDLISFSMMCTEFENKTSR